MLASVPQGPKIALPVKIWNNQLKSCFSCIFEESGKYDGRRHQAFFGDTEFEHIFVVSNKYHTNRLL